MLAHRLAYNGDVVAFKMGRRQGGVGEASRFASSRTAKRGRFAYMADRNQEGYSMTWK
jgi:hypothetical protein